MSREDPQLRIRLPIELKEKIQKLSIKNNKSMNAEITSILEMYFNFIETRSAPSVWYNPFTWGTDSDKYKIHTASTAINRFLSLAKEIEEELKKQK